MWKGTGFENVQHLVLTSNQLERKYDESKKESKKEKKKVRSKKVENKSKNGAIIQ